MRSLIVVCILMIYIFYPVSPSSALNDEVFIHEDFNDLEDWTPLYFPKIKEHTSYSTEKHGDESYLRAESSASASGLVLKKEFNVFEYPKIRWRWKISNVYRKGNAREKSGDDYPLRVYIIFKFDPEKAPIGKRIKYAFLKSIYGEYLPHSSLNYIWANREQQGRIITNTYASEGRMIILQTGDLNAGKWTVQEVNIIEDYHEAFGEDPPSAARLAVMNDSDDTKESAVSYMDYIEVFR